MCARALAAAEGDACSLALSLPTSPGGKHAAQQHQQVHLWLIYPPPVDRLPQNTQAKAAAVEAAQEALLRAKYGNLKPKGRLIPKVRAPCGRLEPSAAVGVAPRNARACAIASAWGREREGARQSTPPERFSLQTSAANHSNPLRL